MEWRRPAPLLHAHVRWPGNKGMGRRPTLRQAVHAGTPHVGGNKQGKWGRQAAKGPGALAEGGRRRRHFVAWAIGGGSQGGLAALSLTKMPAKLEQTKVYVFLHWAASKPVSVSTRAPSRYGGGEHGGRITRVRTES